MTFLMQLNGMKSNRLLKGSMLKSEVNGMTSSS